MLMNQPFMKWVALAILIVSVVKLIVDTRRSKRMDRTLRSLGKGTDW